MLDNNSITQLNLTLAKGQKVIVTDDRVVKRPNYYKVGNGTMNKHGIQSIDLIGELIKMSKPAQTVVGWIKDEMKYDPYLKDISFIAVVKPETSADKQVLKKGFKELKEKDLVRRVKNSQYMLNPNALSTDYAKQMEVWNSLV